eukprot:TRINITY_DN8624_c0_g1_i6.p1 TRINITY_DN8624_c0_g1~~TRINITY_DN8624_c0_g1_i6.p1  ORF type:complete len:207 (+),score=48.65 TRINITY_DN8624_c0_g1_i6:236-856(+)
MGAKEAKPDLFDVQMEMKMASRQMAKEAKRADNSEKAEKKKVANAIAKGQLDIARIHAENAIRNKKESINLERLSARMEAVGEKIAAAYRTQTVSETIAKSVPLLQNALHQMDKIGINQSLDKFQKLFEDLDVKTTDMNSALDDVYQSSIDQSDVDTLVKQVADEHQIELGKEMGEAGMGGIGAKPGAKASVDDFESQLNNLKQMQ